MKKKKTNMDLVGIGRRLKDIRKKLNLRQKEFAEKMDITMVTLSDIETGKKRPGSDILFNLSELYDVNLDFLLFGQGSMFRQGMKMDGVTVEENAFGDYTDDVREMLWYMRNSRLARGGFIALTKEFAYRNSILIGHEIDLKKEKNEQETSGSVDKKAEGGIK
jgi:transcriptional regulator with XRE-family HTH domain